MGSSTAFWLKQHEAGRDMKVVVVERDPKVCITKRRFWQLKCQDQEYEIMTLSIYRGNTVHEGLDCLIGGRSSPTVLTEGKYRAFVIWGSFSKTR
jgi:hypothetical protein